ncbi:MAG: tRNA (adenosine(37)-N6)-dimethylallyltransferase MiaA [Kiloniellaceae bacterium]
MAKTSGKASPRPPVVVVTGPTASGKSGLALTLAEAFGGVVINADSMQVYRELAILTARPGADALARAAHRLYGVLPGRERCSAGRWRTMALAEIAATQAAGKLPLLVGGAGLYLRALERGLAPVPGIPAAVRAAARALHQKLGGEAFHAALAIRDPATAARLRPGDTQRLIRAWEVMEATGRSLAEWQAAGADAAGTHGGSAPYRFLHLVRLPPRERLYAACDARLLRMIEAGALDEVRALLALGLDPSLPVMKALGVRELSGHLAGALSLDEAIARAQQATRNFAKRQMTWLRTQTPRDDGRTVILSEQFLERLDPDIFTIIRRFLLTG